MKNNFFRKNIMENLTNYGLDMHCTMILEEYRDARPIFEKMKEVVLNSLQKCISENGIYVTAIEGRIKQEKSLAGKLELKGSKYQSLQEITDILGTRVITFYSEEVDKISALVESVFDVDWSDSVDKRKIHNLQSFGYQSLHYICRIPKKLFFDASMPEINEFRFEIQMRSALQHIWATIEHDIGYKSGVEIPNEYKRSLFRLAGVLELADEQFSTIRTNITDYRRKVEGLVSSGKFDEVPLDESSFRQYLVLKPFEKLSKKIAAINQAEINISTSMPYLSVLKHLGMKTLGDVERLKHDYGVDAYQLAVHQIGTTDIDIINSTVAIQNLLLVYILENNGGEQGLVEMFELLDGPSEYNSIRAKRILESSKHLAFMNKKDE